MGIDKLRLVTFRSPCPSFLDEVNHDLHLPRREAFYAVRVRHPEEFFVHRESECSITTQKGVTPAFFFQMNFFAPGQGRVNILEVNPNKLPEGRKTLEGILEKVFGEDHGDLKISRIDLNADVEIPVDYLYRTLRIPLKRKSSRYLKKQPEKISTFSNRGMTGFYIGASPAQLRVYDKREEMKRLRESVEGLPQILTRLEWEFSHRKCPVKKLSDLSDLLFLEPFRSIQILSSPDFYDFHNDPKNSQRRYLFRKLAEDYGSHEATRILNYGRNFKRDFLPILLDGQKLKEELQESYQRGVRTFFENRAA